MAQSVGDFNVRDHLDVYWLRPEAALWDTIAAKHLGNLLRGKRGVVELGIGNGYFSFLMLGGKFKPEFDWFYSVDPTGFWDSKDIFDHDAGMTLSEFIRKPPDTRLSIGLDHKRQLLSQAARLDFVDELIEHDCNMPLPVRSFMAAYSNILYWLRDPLLVMDRIGSRLPQGGELITVFPNSAFYRACDSYVRDGLLWKLLNRGRASHIMWHMDLPEFEREVRKRSIFELKRATRYLSPLILKIWDVGLRPLSVPLIKMANSLNPQKRLEIKNEWCDTVEKFAEPLLNVELETGHLHGGFNLVVLVRR